MRYQKATEILPEELVELIQEYIDGGYVYIPRKHENKKNWGEGTSIKEELQSRNEEIYEKYQDGFQVSELAELYYLSEKSIQRILLAEKQKSKK
ncbi:hypothetical protein GPL15_21060 [Clostridium sp. MCC353]|uniref:CD3324 family protein n=1 Tax=Clostridium sp. MCC353 TaxID=2592646 RepID=UPI001C0173D4|nr:CD3324 family protein [Clostridium sp. MCC353]MBT9778970.1 hypothetical protein [Clostridium sp. MCC353]